MAWTVVLLAAVACGARLVEPLHATRLGHRQAGRWLATCADASGAVLDTRGWTGLYSGRKTYRYDDAREAFADPKLAYVVLERRELGFPGRRSRTLRYLLEVAGEPVAAFSECEATGQARRTVIVYRWNAERFSRWRAAHVDSPGTSAGAKERPKNTTPISTATRCRERPLWRSVGCKTGVPW